MKRFNFEEFKIGVRDWYMKTFPDDDLGNDINPKINFYELYQKLLQGIGVYKYLADDSIIRERCFVKLSELLRLDYDHVYNLWLSGDGD